MSASEYDHDRPWVRQPLDSELSFAWLREYLALGMGRRLRDLVKRHGCPWTWPQLEALAHEHAWRERAEAWDNHLADARDEATEDAIRSDAKTEARRHKRIARKLQELSENELNKLLKAQKQAEAFGVVSPREALRYAVEGVKLGRLVHGDTTENVGGGPDFSALSAEELRQLRALQQKALTR